MKNYILEIAILIAGLIIIHSFFLFPIYQGDSVYDPVLAGQFGDLIGGYVGTVFLLISIVLLVLNVRLQRNAINLQEMAIQELREESNFKLIFSEIKELKEALENYKNPYNKKQKGSHGIEGFLRMREDPSETPQPEGFRYDGDRHLNYLIYFEFIQMEFIRILDLLNNLKTNDVYKRTLLNDLKHLNLYYFSSCLKTMNMVLGIYEHSPEGGSIIEQKQKDIFRNFNITTRKISNAETNLVT